MHQACSILFFTTWLRASSSAACCPEADSTLTRSSKRAVGRRIPCSSPTKARSSGSAPGRVPCSLMRFWQGERTSADCNAHLLSCRRLRNGGQRQPISHAQSCVLPCRCPRGPFGYPLLCSCKITLVCEILGFGFRPDCGAMLQPDVFKFAVLP